MATAIGRDAIFGFGLQADIATAPTAWYQHYAVRVDGGEVDNINLFEPEIGGKPVPTGAFSAGPMGVASVEMRPRLQDTFGRLLYALTGSVTTMQPDAVNEPDVYDHKFPFATTLSLPYMAWRVWMNKSNAVQNLGRVLTGGRITAFVLDLASGQPARATFALRSVDYSFEDPSTWTWSNATLEDHSTVPIGSNDAGYFKIPGYSANELPIVSARVSVANAPLDPRLERVYGSSKLDDITITDQVVTIDVTLKWKDPNLYRSILAGSASGTGWTAQPFEQDLEVWAQAPKLIGTSTAMYHAMKLYSARCLWQATPPRLASGGAVMVTLRGTPLDSANFFEITLRNGATAYP